MSAGYCEFSNRHVTTASTCCLDEDPCSGHHCDFFDPADDDCFEDGDPRDEQEDE